MKDGRRELLAGLALGFLFATAARALLSTLFYLSLATLRMNGTAFWTLVLLAPLLAPLVPRARWPAALAGLATAALPFARFTGAYVPLGALAVGAGALALAQRAPLGLLGALGGVALNGALLLAGASEDLMLLPWASLAALGLALAAAAPVEPAPRRSLSSGLAWGALLALQLAFLASPYALARHLDTPAWALAGASLAGLALAPLLPRGGPFVALAGLAALLDVAIVESPLALLSVLALQAVLGAAALRLPAPHGLALGVALAGALFGLLFFGQVLGPLEWRLAVPALALLPLGALLRRTRAPRVPRTWPVALALGLLVLPVAIPAPDVAPHEGDALTVVNWNVHQGFGNRGALDPALYAEALRAMRPDVLVLQEANTARLSSGGLDLPEYLARELGLRRIADGPGISVLARFPPADAPLPPPQDWTTIAALDVHGTTVHVQGVHLARSPPVRLLQAQEILRLANETPGPRILAGDLNSCPAGSCFGNRPPEPIHAMLGTAYQDAWSAQHAPTDPAGNTHPAASPRRRIDVVLVRGFDVLDAGPVRNDLTRWGSDHLPVTARLSLPAS